MRTCKVKPSASECRRCGDTADHFGGVPNCFDCPYDKRTYELLSIESGFFGDYAFVLIDGKIHKVALDRVYDIKTRSL